MKPAVFRMESQQVSSFILCSAFYRLPVFYLLTRLGLFILRPTSL